MLDSTPPATDSTLSILVARPDVPYMMRTVPHLVGACRHPFGERVLVVDTAPLHRRYRSNPNLATLDDLRQCCGELVAAGVVDRAVDIDYSPAARRRILGKHFGRDPGHTHDFRGYPILGLPFALDRAAGRYFVHFDCDVLLHQEAGADWVQDGMDLMSEHPDVLFVSPLSGPPSPTGELKQRGIGYDRDPRGFYRFTTFTSRKFLVDRQRFEAVLPVPPVYVSTYHRCVGWLTGRSALYNWEISVSQRLASSGWVRADLDSPRAWALHSPDHGPAFLAKLPAVIERVEAGTFPPEQTGDYDLRLDLW